MSRPLKWFERVGFESNDLVTRLEWKRNAFELKQWLISFELWLVECFCRQYPPDLQDILLALSTIQDRIAWQASMIIPSLCYGVTRTMDQTLRLCITSRFTIPLSLVEAWGIAEKWCENGWSLISWRPTKSTNIEAENRGNFYCNFSSWLWLLFRYFKDYFSEIFSPILNHS